MVSKYTLIFLYINLLFLASCSLVSKPHVQKLLSKDQNQHKNIFVFLDGTNNNPESETNVWRLFKLISENKDPQTSVLYIDGVGCTKNPVLKFIGSLFGYGMQDRLLESYDFIADQYSPGDNIYLFGFSRGAHEARSLAGFLAYAGVPITSVGETKKRGLWLRKRTWEKVLELIKEKSDKRSMKQWVSWKHGQPPLLAAEIKKELGLEMQTIEITFLGVWDTVPGSSFKEFGLCKEEKDIIKGDLYKSNSYPTIHRIAHAVSLDEKRSMFKPLLICPAINKEYTEINEMWFPGAHSDVGGGYKDTDKGLPNISLNWMLDLLEKSYQKLPKEKENAKGLAHCSICDRPENEGSNCENRLPPKDAQLHPSVQERKISGNVPISVNGKIQFLPYPTNSFQCPTRMSIEQVCDNK